MCAESQPNHGRTCGDSEVAPGRLSDYELHGEVYTERRTKTELARHRWRSTFQLYLKQTQMLWQRGSGFFDDTKGICHGCCLLLVD